MIPDESKKALRTLVREGLSSLPPAIVKQKSLGVTQTILESDLWKSTSDPVLAFLSFGQEISLDVLIEQALSEGRTVGIPLVEKNRIISFRVLNSLDEPLKISSYGIREPLPGSSLIPPEKLSKALILVPGLAFTPAGVRLGQGGGYYDRFLSGIPDSARLMGVCYEFQIRKFLPVEGHDKPVHGVYTEKKAYYC